MENTAIDWLVSRIAHGGLVSKTQFDELVKQAKEIQKEHHKKTWSEGMFCETGAIQAFEEYYNKNFKSK